MPPTPYAGYQPTPSPIAYGNPNVPQFATFEDPSGKKINEDSLPPMPSWETATKRRVEERPADGDLEMGQLGSQPQRMRGGYNSVPNGPMSPASQHPQGAYFNETTHSYHSDLGAQRLGGTDTRYNNFQSVPLGPPPTYRSTSNAPSISSDKFITGAASPSPHDYHQPYQSYHQQQSSYAPTSPSTRYEPQPDYQTRPPSFLHTVRNAGSGTYRVV